MTPRRPTDGCRSFERWLTPLVDGELDAVHAVEVEEHLDGCEECRERVAFLRALRASVRVAGRLTAPRALRERLLGSLAAEREADRGSPAVRVLPQTSDAPHALPPSRGAAQGLVKLRYVLPLAAAACVAILVGAAQHGGVASDTLAGARRIQSGLTAFPLGSADAFKGPALASLEPLDQLIEDLVTHHAEPLPPETTDPQGLQKFDRYVGVRVPRPRFEPFNARYLGARMHPVRMPRGDLRGEPRSEDNARAAMLQYMFRNQHRVTVYVFDPMRVPLRANHLERRELDRRKIYVGRLRGYSVAASERDGVGYALASDMGDDESARLVMVASK